LSAIFSIFSIAETLSVIINSMLDLSLAKYAASNSPSLYLLEDSITFISLSIYLIPFCNSSDILLSIKVFN
jgi:hypothetical protein